MPEENVMKLLWETEQEILDVIHKVCTEHGLRYSLGYGTLLGAVRHGGFIPWDDDIDIIMPREDYEELLKIWSDAAPEGYLLQNVRTNPDFSQSFTKIRKDHTTFLESKEESFKNYHKGIFVDIFPGDRVAGKGCGRTLQYIAGAVHLLYNRGFTSGTGGIIGLVERVLLSAPKKKYAPRRVKAENYLRRWNGDEKLQYFFPCTIGECRLYYPADLFNNLKTVAFNGKMYMCVANPDEVLRCGYGDYMQLPPEEERVWKHHPIIIDFEHNYEELEGNEP